MATKLELTQSLYEKITNICSTLDPGSKEYVAEIEKLFTCFMWINNDSFKRLLRSYYRHNDYELVSRGDNKSIVIDDHTTIEDIYNNIDRIDKDNGLYISDIWEAFIRFHADYDPEKSRYLVYMYNHFRNVFSSREMYTHYYELLQLPWIYDDISAEIKKAPKGTKRYTSVLRYASRLKNELMIAQANEGISEADFLLRVKARARTYTSEQIDDIYNLYINYEKRITLSETGEGLENADELIEEKNASFFYEGKYQSAEDDEVFYLLIDDFIDTRCDEIEKIIMRSYMDDTLIKTNEENYQVRYSDYYIEKIGEENQKPIKDIAKILTQYTGNNWTPEGVKLWYRRCLQGLMRSINYKRRS